MNNLIDVRKNHCKFYFIYELIEKVSMQFWMLSHYIMTQGSLASSVVLDLNSDETRSLEFSGTGSPSLPQKLVHHVVQISI